MSGGLEEIRTPGAPRAIGPYAQAMSAAGWIFCSGQIGLDPETEEVVGGGVEQQTDRALRNLMTVLEEAGASAARVVKTTVYLADMEEFEAMNRVYGRYFGDHRPARATVEVSGLPKGAAVEIEAVAFVE